MKQELGDALIDALKLDNKFKLLLEREKRRRTIER